VRFAHTVAPVAVALGLAGFTAEPVRGQTDSLGLSEAMVWLTDSLPHAGSFALRDRLNGQPVGATTRALSDVHVDVCTMSWTVTTVSGPDSTRVVLTASLKAVNPALATALVRDSVHTAAGRLTHEPAIWEVTAPTRDGSSAETLENSKTKLKIPLPSVDLFVTARDDAWRTAAAIAAVARACQAG
jgi:hypothetical protein